MNLKLLQMGDKLRGTLNAMMHTNSEEELEKLFSQSIQELLDYAVTIKEDIKNK